MRRTLLLTLLLCSLTFYRVNSQLYDGDDCQVGSTSGVCRRIANCPSAAELINSGVFPQLCSYEGSIPIVCCVNTRATTAPPRKPTRRPTARPTARPTSTTTTTTTTTTTPRPTTRVAITQRIGKSWDKCVEYASAVYKEAEAGPLLAGDIELEADCAMDAEMLIIGGEKCVPKEFPHMAALGFGEANAISWLCGGSLISERFILTAAHCLVAKGRGRVRWVRLGDLNLKQTDDDARPQTVEVDQVFAHPQYKPPGHYNDIALLRLKSDVELNPYARPACLHSTFDTPTGGVATATGWGVVEWTNAEGSNDLMKVDLRYHDPARCNATYRPIIKPNSKLAKGFVEESMICAGDPQGMRDTCVGDSGGPLQIRLNDPYCMYSIVGLTSFGVVACGVSNSPAVYTRISHYIPWIENIVWPN